MTGFVVTAVGGLCLVQDAGRPGHSAIGVGVSGAADRASYALANRLLGNQEGAPALEVVLGGLEIEATHGVWLCVTGAPVPLLVGGRAEPTGAVIRLGAGERLRMGAPSSGLRSYLAVRGGFDVPLVLGSAARDTLGGLGPSPIAVGHQLLIGGRIERDIEVDAVPPTSYDESPVLRVVRGPKDAWIADPERLVNQPWTVRPASDRIGVRLDGAPLERVDDRRELPSEGALRGAIQVPPAGLPVILGPDHPVTGGYPVIGVVVDGDTDRVAQLRPGEQLRFRWV